MGLKDFCYDHCPDKYFLKTVNLYRFLTKQDKIKYSYVSKNHWVIHYQDYDLHCPSPRWVDKSLDDFKNKFNSVYPIVKGDVCVDVGACIGDTTLPMLVLSGNASNVYGVEPMFSNQCFFRMNLSDVVLLPFAISDKNGNEYLHCQEFASTDNSLDVDYLKLGKCRDNVIVKCISLDSLIDYTGFIDFCKIDVQGVETRILKNGNKFFSNVDKLVVETHNIPYVTYQDCLNILFDKGFETFFNPFTEIIHSKKK